MFPETLSQALCIPAADLPPANRANNATAYTVGPVDMSLFKRLLAKVSAGVVASGGTVTCYLQASNASNGTYANISATNQTVVLNTSNTACTLEVRGDQIGTNNRYVQLAVLIATNSVFTQAEVFGGESPYKPASNNDVNTTYVTQRLVL